MATNTVGIFGSDMKILRSKAFHPPSNASNAAVKPAFPGLLSNGGVSRVLMVFTS
jgi:hypothetical protein